ncbi:hypothetical protein ACF0H5_013180 [Mactra antiquata]
MQLPKVTTEDIVQLQQAKDTPLQYIVSPDRPTVDSPFGKVQLGSILSYQVHIFNMIKPRQQRYYKCTSVKSTFFSFKPNEINELLCPVLVI